MCSEFQNVLLRVSKKRLREITFLPLRHPVYSTNMRSCGETGTRLGVSDSSRLLFTCDMFLRTHQHLNSDAFWAHLRQNCRVLQGKVEMIGRQMRLIIQTWGFSLMSYLSWTLYISVSSNHKSICMNAR